MNPGRARLVETPSSNSEGDLLKAVAAALGIESALTQSGAYLRPKIEYVLRQSGVLLVFEEAHFLWPSKLSKTAVPARLNWIRRSVMDAGLPVAFICTPQSYQNAQRRFVKATAYPIEQLEGRFLPTVRLPESVPVDDLLAIARKHLPGVGEPHLNYLVNVLGATERNYCSDVSRIGRLAFINAEDAGRRIPIMADIDAAMRKALPQAAEAPAAEAPGDDFKPPARRMKSACTARSGNAQRRRIAPAPPADERDIFEVPRRDESPVIHAD